MRLPARPSPMTTIAALSLLVVSGIIGYVYSHEPSRDVLHVELDTAADESPSYLSGTIASIDSNTVVFVDASGVERTVTLMSDAPVEDLVRLNGAPTAGTTVNIGVDDTQFGQVLTGIVVVESGP